MTGPELDALIAKAQKGEMNPYEQNCLAFETVTFRAMALRLERCVHELVKAAEELKAEDIDNQINLRLKAEQELAALKFKVGL